VASVTGAYVGAKLQDSNVIAPMIGSGFGTLSGAVIGKGIEQLQYTIPQYTILKISGL